MASLQNTKLTYTHRGEKFTFLDILNKYRKKIKKTIPFMIASKWTQFLGINLTWEVKDLYTENYTALLKEIKGMNKRKQSYVNELEDLILSRCPYYPKQSRNSIKSLSVSPQCFFFIRNRKFHPQIFMESSESLNCSNYF